jgi:hypothetical protein
MEARINRLKHPSGIVLETPLLISSFSSKGFKFLKKIKSGKKIRQQSEVGELIKSTAEAITECALVSAFDINYYLGSEENLIRKYNLLPKILFIDSGGYETIEDYDFSEVYKYPINSKKWSSEMHSTVLEKFESIPSVFVSYDNGQDRRISLKSQIERAKKLFDRFPMQMNDFLIKPGNKKDHLLNIDEIVENISLLKRFNIIGMTEKELGDSTAERMRNIKEVRLALDKVGSSSPIHIFGNLDPLISVLYFISGAEIFDGLTWLRFAFYEGMTLYKSNVDIFAGRQNEKDHLNNKMVMMQNLIYLRSLTQQMKSFVKTYNEGKRDEAYNCFSYVGDRVKQIIHTSK